MDRWMAGHTRGTGWMKSRGLFLRPFVSCLLLVDNYQTEWTTNGIMIRNMYVSTCLYVLDSNQKFHNIVSPPSRERREGGYEGVLLCFS